MSYVVPSVQISQEFSIATAATNSVLPALIIGPQYSLFRYGVAAEKPLAAVLDSGGSGTYAGSSDAYLYQNKVSTSTTDLSRLTVTLDNVVAKYFSTSTSVTQPAGTTNQIQAGTSGSPTLVFQAGNGSSLSAAFNNRAVQVGDTVVLGNGTTTLTSTVQGVNYSTVAATVPSTATRVVGSDNETINIGGSYTGASNITYRIVCVTGGTVGVSGTAVLKVYSNQTDSSGPFLAVTGVTNSLGTLGLTFAIPSATASTLAVGDEWDVVVTAAAPGPYNVLTIADAIPSSGWSSITLNSVSINLNGVVIAPLDPTGATTYWTANQTGVTLAGSLTTTVPAVNSNGVPLQLPITSATVYVTRYDLLIANVGSINSLTDPSTVAATLGTVDPHNALAQGVYNALLNSGGNAVYYTAIATDDINGYNSALTLAAKSKNYYSVVPLTFDTATQTAVQAHVNNLSTPTTAKWRIAWLSLPLNTTTTLLNQNPSNASYFGTVGQAPGGSTYNYVTVTDSTAALITKGVTAGDILNYNFSTNVDGSVSSVQATITSVLSNTTFLVNGLVDRNGAAVVAAITTPFKITITRNLTTSQQAADYAARVSNFNDRRVRIAFPPAFNKSTTPQWGYFLAAALAGLRSGSAPHRSLTNVQVLGPTDLSLVTNVFSDDDLNTIAGAGTWIVTQDAVGGPGYSRQQLTTAIAEGLNYQEDSITTNIDSITYGLSNALAPYKGTYNVNPGTVLKVKAAIDRTLTNYMTNTWTEASGNQLNGYTIDSIGQNATFADRIDVKVTLTGPDPLNNLSIVLAV